MSIDFDAGPLGIARQAFAGIRDRFPHLHMIDDTHAEVELSVTFPVQPGLRHEVNLNVQNVDELYLNISRFCCSWFPCTQQDCVQGYADAVCGFLSGSHRVTEHYCNEVYVKARLQRPVGASWETIAVSYGGIFRPLRYLDPWAIRYTDTIQND